MKKSVFLAVMAVLLVVGLVATGFAQQKSAPAKPQYGGVLKVIRVDGPKVLSYLPEMGPVDESLVFPAVERIMDNENEGGVKSMVPVLAESVTVAPDKKSILIKVRKGVKFHDGSDLDAEVVAWNYQLYKDTKRLQYEQQLTRIEVVDNYTVRLHMAKYNNQLITAWGWTPIFSKKAWEKAGGGNADKSKEWARTNVVGTGPFKLAEYKRDNYIKWTKNENYWQKGKPYLDGVEVRFIPDPVTQSAMFQTKEVDMWVGPPVRQQADMEKRGFVRNSSWPGRPWLLIPNTKDANSPWNDKRVREAAEYAIDKAAIAKALGVGYYKPMTMVAPPGEWAYDPAYKGRSYDPEKAKKLLAEAGFAGGLKAKLTVMSRSTDVEAATAAKMYLDAAGFQIDLDVADPGRFFGSVWKAGWKDLIWMFTGLDADFLVTFQRWFGDEPLSDLASFKRPPELIKMSQESRTHDKEADQRAAAKKIVRYMADEALVIPVFFATEAYLTQPYVHTDYLHQGFVRWKLADAWMDKH